MNPRYIRLISMAAALLLGRLGAWGVGQLTPEEAFAAHPWLEGVLDLALRALEGWARRRALAAIPVQPRPAGGGEEGPAAEADCREISLPLSFRHHSDARGGAMATKEAQINLRLPADLDAWIETQAGGKRGKPEYIRRVLERARAQEAEESMLRMFNSAWDSLSDRERAVVREEREAWLGARADDPSG